MAHSTDRRIKYVNGARAAEEAKQNRRTSTLAKSERDVTSSERVTAASGDRSKQLPDRKVSFAARRDVIDSDNTTSTESDSSDDDYKEATSTRRDDTRKTVVASNVYVASKQKNQPAMRSSSTNTKTQRSEKTMAKREVTRVKDHAAQRATTTKISQAPASNNSTESSTDTDEDEAEVVERKSVKTQTRQSRNIKAQKPDVTGSSDEASDDSVEERRLTVVNNHYHHSSQSEKTNRRAVKKSHKRNRRKNKRKTTVTKHYDVIHTDNRSSKRVTLAESNNDGSSTGSDVSDSDDDTEEEKAQQAISTRKNTVVVDTRYHDVSTDSSVRMSRVSKRKEHRKTKTSKQKNSEKATDVITVVNDKTASSAERRKRTKETKVTTAVSGRVARDSTVTPPADQRDTVSDVSFTDSRGSDTETDDSSETDDSDSVVSDTSSRHRSHDTSTHVAHSQTADTQRAVNDRAAKKSVKRSSSADSRALTGSRSLSSEHRAAQASTTAQQPRHKQPADKPAAALVAVESKQEDVVAIVASNEQHDWSAPTGAGKAMRNAQLPNNVAVNKTQTKDVIDLKDNNKSSLQKKPVINERSSRDKQTKPTIAWQNQRQDDVTEHKMDVPPLDIDPTNLVSYDTDDDDPSSQSPAATSVEVRAATKRSLPVDIPLPAAARVKLPVIQERSFLVSAQARSASNDDGGYNSGSPSLVSSRGSVTERRSPSQWTSNGVKIPRHLRHLGEDLEAVMSFPHTESLLPDIAPTSGSPRRVSSLPSQKTQEDVLTARARVGSGPSSTQGAHTPPRLLNRLTEERKIERLEREVDKKLSDVILRFPLATSIK